MAETVPELDLGEISSNDFDIQKSTEDSEEIDHNAKKMEDLDLFEEEEKFKNEENIREMNFKTNGAPAVLVTTEESKKDTLESRNLQMTTLPLDSSAEFDPLTDAAISNVPSSMPAQLPVRSDLVSEVERLSLDHHVPVAADCPTETKENTDTFWIDIAISEPKKVDEGVSAYIVYKIATKTNLPSFHRRTASVHRRFSDFLGLHSRLVEKYAREGRIIPQAPEKSIIGMAKVKVSKTDTAASSDFLEHRRAQLERFLKHLSANQVFRSDPIFVDFLETEGDLQRASHTSTLSGVSVKRLFSKVGDGISRVALRVEETDEWFENRMDVMCQSESSLKSLLTSVESVIIHRRDCAAEMELLSQDFSTLATVEDDQATSKTLDHLAELWASLRDSHGVQANDDSVNLLAFVKDSLCMILSSKDAMTERVKAWKAWKDSEALLARKREQLVKLQTHSKTERNLPAEIAQFETNAEKYQEDFERLSANLKQESLRLDRSRRNELKETLLSSLESALANQQRSLKLWQSFLEDTKQGSNT